MLFHAIDLASRHRRPECRLLGVRLDWGRHLVVIDHEVEDGDDDHHDEDEDDHHHYEDDDGWRDIPLSSWPKPISISSSSRDCHHMIIWPLLHHHKIIMRSSYDPMMIHLAHVFLRNNWGRGGMACHCHRHLSIVKVHIRNTMQYWCNIIWWYLHQQQQSS